MKKDKTLYTEDSIKTLSPRDFTRLRPATYLGSNEYSTQLVKEVFANALDEHIIGHGKEIDVSICEENGVCNCSVQDHGQGFPINVDKDGETILQAAFDRFNTSGKYDDDGVYGGASLGLNGIGAKLTNFLSTKLLVRSSDGKNFEELIFEDGIFKSRETGKDTYNEGSGTLVIWEPDPQFFQNYRVNINELKKLFEDIAALCPELTINFIVNYDTFVYHSKNGLADLFDKKVSKKEILNKRFTAKKSTENELIDIAMTYTSDYSETIIPYVNYGLTEAGAHIAAVKYGLTRQINRYASANGLLKKNDDPLTQVELSEGLVLAFNVKAKNVKYDSQTKVRIVDLDKTLINDVINNEFVDWLNNNPKDVKTIVNKALTARKAREAAQKAKDNIRNTGAKNKKFISLPTKLVDAYSKNRNECELFITEGDSAANGLIAKRDGKTQAVFPIRGKVLSCRKAAVEKIYGNQEISNIVKAIGLDIDKTTGKLIYDEKKLRYGKIILAADADADGYDIRLLLINMFWWLCPELIINGHIYVAIPPLFRITTKKNEYIYLVDQKALNNYKKTHKEQFIINRNKGLGESSSEELAQYLLRPDTRTVHQLLINDIEETDNLLEIFMGTKIDSRRDYLLANANSIPINIE